MAIFESVDQFDAIATFHFRSIFIVAQCYGVPVRHVTFKIKHKLSKRNIIKVDAVQLGNLHYRWSDNFQLNGLKFTKFKTELT